MKKPHLLFLAAAALAGLALIVAFFANEKSSSASNLWTQALAKVDTVAAGDPAAVEYRYSFHGRDYAGKGNAQAGRFTAGQTALIYVNPGNPAESVIELGRRPSQWLWISGVFVLVFGTAVGLFNPPLTRPKKKPTLSKKARPMERLQVPKGIPRPRQDSTRSAPAQGKDRG